MCGTSSCQIAHRSLSLGRKEKWISLLDRAISFVLIFLYLFIYFFSAYYSRFVHMDGEAVIFVSSKLKSELQSDFLIGGVQWKRAKQISNIDVFFLFIVVCILFFNLAFDLNLLFRVVVLQGSRNIFWEWQEEINPKKWLKTKSKLRKKNGTFHRIDVLTKN